MRIDGTYQPRDPADLGGRAALARRMRTFGLKLNRRLLPNEGVLSPLIMRLLTSNDDIITAGRGSAFDGPPTVHRYPGAVGERIEIGNFSSFAKDVTFMLGGNHDTRRVTTSPVYKVFGLAEYDPEGDVAGRGGIIIGSDVWVGRGSFLMAGARLGNGSVVGAQSVVTGRVEPYSIVVGNPAREVRKRFPPETVTRLLDSAWWELPNDFLIAHVSELASHDIAGFVDLVQEWRRTHEKTRGNPDIPG